MKTQTDNATARPWYKVHNTNYVQSTVSEYDNYICECDSFLDAELIVKAVNNFDALLEACKEIEKWTQAFDGSVESLETMRNEISEIAYSAIKQATESEG